MRSLFLISLLVGATLAFSQASQSDSQTLKSLLEEVRLLRVDLRTTTVAAQRVQIGLYRLQIQDAAVARASAVLEAAHSKLTQLQDAHRHFVTEIEQLEHQRDQAQDFSERPRIEEERLPRAKMSLEQVSHEEEQRLARTNEAEGELKDEQVKLNGLHSLLDQLDQRWKMLGMPGQALPQDKARSAKAWGQLTPPLSGHSQQQPLRLWC